jgi:hypothetical protein
MKTKQLSDGHLGRIGRCVSTGVFLYFVLKVEG